MPASSIDFGRAYNIGIPNNALVQIVYSRYGDIYARGFAAWENPKFRKWVPIATATPPEQIPLNLAEGWQIKNYAKFWKNQFGEVSLFFRVGKATGETAQGTIATLPAGFRPAVPVHAAAVTYPSLHPALLVIGSDGTVMVFCNTVEGSAEGSFCGSATFVAAM